MMSLFSCQELSLLGGFLTCRDVFDPQAEEARENKQEEKLVWTMVPESPNVPRTVFQYCSQSFDENEEQQRDTSHVAREQPDQQILKVKDVSDYDSAVKNGKKKSTLIVVVRRDRKNNSMVLGMVP